MKEDGRSKLGKLFQANVSEFALGYDVRFPMPDFFSRSNYLHWRIMKLRAFEQKTHKEIEEEFAMSQNRVNSILQNGHFYMQRELRKAEREAVL